MSYEENKSIVTAYFEAYNAHDWDQVVDLFAESLIFRHPNFPEPQIGAAAWRPGGSIRQYIESSIKLVPDLHAEVEHVFGEARWFCGEGILEGIHMETQKTIQLSFSQIFKVEESKITEMHLYYDLLRFRTQLGLA